MTIHKVELFQPLDMKGAGGDQDNGWFANHGVQVLKDHILLCTTREPLIEFLIKYTYDDTYDPNNTEYKIEEIEMHAE